ncbi:MULTISPECIES: AzlD family protein [Aminobacter]|jgi:uncharacterized membrane protein|uniref:Membrane protein n=2 Tax=Aminobacter TaxID=31988 RepID=A0AAC8YNP9_AMIAI|nr:MULTISPECIES: AzlD family protein [Aminobacter]AMS41528.1 Membrane protein [Aminobacter aminovorans]MBA8904406.1 putative membrane protein [Aminobacter ciceronei]MBA9018184.1 putative membrane protein [Aminobacter ciceronei]MBB3704124.1 putative membrane protein [Aminobacter aminovorans]MRX33158.1 AzlD family protein [Aminobacter sp. MDW-2]
MIDQINLLAIVLMASVTYLTRIGGYVMLRNRTLSPRATAVMEAAPGCVLISVIAPDFVSDNPADLLALAITVLAATRLSMLPTVIVGIASAGVLRHLLG